jgi:hypothetical protein
LGNIHRKVYNHGLLLHFSVGISHTTISTMSQKGHRTMSSKNKVAVAAVVAVQSPVVTIPVSEINLDLWREKDILGELCNQPQPLGSADLGLPEGTFYVRKPTRSDTKHDGNDLGRAVTLILQMLPLTGFTSDPNHTCNSLTPEDRQEVQQLLLKAAYILETADSTHYSKCKIDVV